MLSLLLLYRYVKFVSRFCLFLQFGTHKFRKKNHQTHHRSDINLAVLHVLAHVQGHYQAKSV